MLSKLVLAITLGLAAVNAQSTFQFQETYPESYVVPTPKPEWLELISNVTITDAPIIQQSADGVLQQPTGVTGDPNCVWTFTQCLQPDDLYTCPPGKWSVTFDDGPSADTPRLLEYLKSVNQKVTFFIVGTQVKEFPLILREAYDQGHEIAMHSWSHSYMTTLTNEELVGELKWNEQIIKEVIGVSPKYFRPPFGNIDNRVRDICKALGFTPVIWSTDTNDWYLTEHADTFQVDWIKGNITEWAATNTTTGGMSLSHDLYNVTVDAAIEYMPTFMESFELETVGQCNNQQAYKEGAGNINGTTAQPSASVSASSSAASSDSTVAAQDADGESSATWLTTNSFLVTASIAAITYFNI
ncbi:hypothetical protein BDB00DRAFT_927160 [Zychaea mexicana]|uniref:uncharacterized protein n=1 Tax=Zychaea mexicana TaxID=64656 RepID=UPI0022FE1453|nr:uncharacterized protein BDB00DRAFT_927160 [Zychaea mexicana]KAI9495814.1 hypothetical protein BDB00DRAFT_927160 [Zychaea mexicana]